jgi:hypothetical protein
MTAFPQIVSRIGHPNPAVCGIIADLVVTILCEYPQQGLWYFTPVVQGKSAERDNRGKAILACVQQVRPIANMLLSPSPIKLSNIYSRQKGEETPQISSSIGSH